MLGLSSDSAPRIMMISLDSLANPTAGNSLLFNSITSANSNGSGAVWSSTTNRIVITGASKPTMTNGMVSGGFQYYTGGNIGGEFMKMDGDNLVPLLLADYNQNAFSPTLITRITTATNISSDQSAYAVNLDENITFDNSVLRTLSVGAGGVILNARNLGETNNVNRRGVVNFGSNHAWIGAYSAASQSNIHSRVIADNGMTIMGVSQSLNLTAPNNSITGAVNINGGRASFANGSIGAANDVVVGALGTFTGPNANVTTVIGGLSGTGRVTAFFQGNNTTNTIQISPASGSHTFNGYFANGDQGRVLNLTKSGNGIQIFGEDSIATHTGTTSVTAGTLLINGDFSGATGAVTVSGGTLGGSGTIGGATTIQSGGTLAPGNSPGLLTFNSSLTLAGAVVMEIGATTTRGGTFDAIDVVGALNYGGSLTLNLTQTFGVGSFSWNLFDFGSQSGDFATVGLTGSYSGALSNSGGTWGLVSGNDTWSFAQDTGVLTLTVIPEPSTWALLALGLTAMIVFRRRRTA
jgi:autotransporter-associated beta strand protein